MIEDEKYKTSFENGYYCFQKGYCKVIIEANDLNNFVEMVEHIKTLKVFSDE